MRPPRTFRYGSLVVATSLAVLVATGCSPSGAGSPEPTPTAQTTSKQSTPEVTIEKPKNLRAVSDSCSLLTAQQLATLGMAAKPKHKDSMLGIPSCDWSGDEFAMTIIPDTNSGGITQIYKTEPDAKKTTVSGYPAAWVDKQSISCRVEIGVSKDAMVGISYFSNTTSDQASQATPCKQGEKIAAMVLKNIPDA